MGSLAGLANELLLESFGSLSNSDLKSIRLVCKQFERLANPHLFKTISLAPNEKAVNIFESIYQHPTIKQCVEEIVYDAAFYARDVAQDILEYQDQLSLLNFDVGDYSLWMAKIKEDVLRDFGKIIESDCVYAASNDPLFAKSFDSALKLGHEIYRSRYAEQNNTLQSGQISLHLSRGLAAMQKIKRIIIDDSLSSPRRDGLVIESTRMPILNRSQYDRAVEWYPSGGIPDGEKQPDGFIAILKAIGLADNQSINELCIRFGSRCGIPYLTVESLAQNSARFVNLQKGVAKLRRLDFRIGDETQGPEESYTQLFASGTCCQLLHAGQELRELVVHPGIRYPYPNILLEQVFGFQEETWPHLTKLYLSEVEVGVSDLTGFLRRHSSTLRHLSLGRIYLMDCRTSWAAIFNDMRDFLTLEGVSVGALLYRENHPCHVESRDKLKPELRRKLELYLLEGGQNPLLT